MIDKSFPALVVRESSDGEYTGEIEQRAIADLPSHDILIEVDYSSLNYKDALSATGVKRVTTSFPHTPGIDAAGTVVTSSSTDFIKSDNVIVTGYDLGMNTAGGYGKYISVPSEWVVRRPKNLNARESMILGTAGFTAGLSVNEIIRGSITPENGPVLVTGASGGVGSIAVAILSKLGFDVIAVSGKKESKATLKDIGADRVIDRKEVDDESGKILLKEQFAAVVDTVGGNILSTAIRSTQHRGIVTACGWVAGDRFDINIYPFMIRGVHLAGIDSVQCPMGLRQQIWSRLGNEWKPESLDIIAEEIALDQVMGFIQPILKGQLSGRKVVKVA